MKLISWNVNGIRAVIKKGFLYEFFDKYEPNILGLQETKAHVNQLDDKTVNIKNYLSFWSSPTDRKGYSGTAVYSNIQPIAATELNEDPVMRNEGRIIKVEYKDFYFLNIYFPNGGGGPHRLQFKMEFYEEFLKVIKELEKTKPVVFCGDVNTAHNEIDLARPKENEKVSGFMRIERDWLDKLVENGFIDCFREFNKEPNNYTWWDQKSRARDRNVGWRIDYFFVSGSLKDKVKNCYHLTEQMGSDHCPVVLELDIPFEENVKLQAEAKLPEEEHVLF